MKILLAGAWQWPWYEKACADAFKRLGHDVVRFSWGDEFKRFTSDYVEPVYRSYLAWFQDGLLWGPKLFKINRNFINLVKSSQPQIVFTYRSTHIFPDTIRLIKKLVPNTIFVQYCNDDPFSTNANKRLWRHLLNSIPLYDLHCVYRHHNIEDFKQQGAKKVILLRSYYMTDQHYPVSLQSADKEILSDVAFVGHYEPDFRADYLESIVRQGIKVNLFGGLWKIDGEILTKNSLLIKLFPVRMVVGEEFVLEHEIGFVYNSGSDLRIQLSNSRLLQECRMNLKTKKIEMSAEGQKSDIKSFVQRVLEACSKSFITI